MLNRVRQDIEYCPRYKQSTLNTGYNKFYKQHNYKNVLLNSVPDLNTPCDTKYILKHNNINFKSKYTLKTLNSEEYKKIKDAVETNIQKFYIKFRWHEKESLLTQEGLNPDIAIQAMDILLNHKIIELESVKSMFSTIMSCIKGHPTAYVNTKKMLDFADFITQDEYKPVYENESVQDNMGRILLFIADEADSIKPKTNLVKYLSEHTEILAKDIDFGTVIDSVKSDNYDAIIKRLTNDESLESPKDNKKPESLFDLLFGAKKAEPLGKLIPKRVKGDGNGFDKIGGQKEAIERLKDLVINPRNYPEIYEGFTTVKGAVLYGPTGTGKSLMARALAEELGCYFVSISSGSMRDKYVGGTERKWDNLFKELEENQPALLFIDEIDGMANDRDSSSQFSKQELDHFLTLVSDIEAKNLDVFIIVATNRLKDLDYAFLRSGRFKEKIAILPPQTPEDVEEIFNIYIEGKKIDIEDIDKNRSLLYNKMLELNYTGSDIKYAVLSAFNEALVRTGIRAKMDAGTEITKEETNNLKIKTVDFLSAFEEKTQNDIVNKSSVIRNSIPAIYKTQKSKANTIAILGSSKTTESILKYMAMCSNTVEDLVSKGKNIVTGCGNSGIMGAAYTAAKEFSAQDALGRPIQNLAILTKQLFGDEDLENCIPLMVADSQAERIERFAEVADTIIVFPGSVNTLQEATTLIAQNYNDNNKKIILVGKDFFKCIADQYDHLYNTGLIKCKPSDLFTIADSEEEIQQILNK